MPERSSSVMTRSFAAIDIQMELSMTFVCEELIFGKKVILKQVPSKLLTLKMAFLCI
jgi:hypothetical protein